jgi:hypothetical protein
MNVIVAVDVDVAAPLIVAVHVHGNAPMIVIEEARPRDHAHGGVPVHVHGYDQGGGHAHVNDHGHVHGIFILRPQHLTLAQGRDHAGTRIEPIPVVDEAHLLP